MHFLCQRRPRSWHLGGRFPLFLFYDLSVTKNLTDCTQLLPMNYPNFVESKL